MSHINPSSIKVVDGFKIRNTIDPDFGIFHTHSTFASVFGPKFYIPKNEWWLDVMAEKEKDFLIRIETTNVGNRTGSHLRTYLKKHLLKKGTVPNFVVRKERRRNLQIVYVDGSIIRMYFDPEFILGGHDYVYHYIPKGEIWLEYTMNPKEVPFLIEHEYLERKLMIEGKSYDIAHEYGTAIEKETRRLKGLGCYPGDANYPWTQKSNEELAKKYYVKHTAKSTTGPKSSALSSINRPVRSSFFKNSPLLFWKKFFRS